MADSILRNVRSSYHLKKKVSASEKATVRRLRDETIDAIPSAVDEGSVNHWSKSSAVIEFRYHLIARFKSTTGGQTRDRGCVIIYRHDYLLRMAPNLARALIAHEFAHVFICSSIDELRQIKQMAAKDLGCE